MHQNSVPIQQQVLRANKRREYGRLNWSFISKYNHDWIWKSSCTKPSSEWKNQFLHTRFVDNTLLLIKNDDIEAIKIEFEKFDSNLKFTYDTFENENPHFLDIEITNNGLKVYRKDTFTGHYVNFSSFVPWLHRISWLRSLVYWNKNRYNGQRV